MLNLSIFWFRRDLRLDDNAALYHALTSSKHVLPVFIFDIDILNRLASKNDPRVSFIYNRVRQLKQDLEKEGSSLLVMKGKPIDVFKYLLSTYEAEALYFNHDYEPSAIARDRLISHFFRERNLHVESFKDQVIFEKDEVVKKDGSPYIVFTPYKRKWTERLASSPPVGFSVRDHLTHLMQTDHLRMPEMNELGFDGTVEDFTPPYIDEQIISSYHLNRDYPHMNGTSRLGIHFRFGTLSIRYAVQKALELNETWLNELIWREFYMMILWHFPRVVDQSFKPRYDYIEWRNNEDEFRAWFEGHTGYPIVDAAMRQINQTGYMHNRLRMITASFLTKHLLIDWRWGESYFAEKLLDYELSSNNGGWQWAAGSGCDAAPYFRIFNPYRQTERFDSHLSFIKKWLPEFREEVYKKPIVDHKFARQRALSVYGDALKKDSI